MNTKIKISRGKYIETDRSIAIIRLNSDIIHSVGQLVMIRYYDTLNNSRVDSLLALGIKDGIGEDCYVLVTTGEYEEVRDVVFSLPDVSALTHGEKYLWFDDTDKLWNYVYLDDNGVNRLINPIENVFRKFVNIEDNYIWFSYDDGKLRREDDFYTRDEINQLLIGFEGDLKELLDSIKENIIDIEQDIIDHETWLRELDNEVFPMSISVVNETGSLFLTGTIQNITLKINVYRKGIDITNECSFVLNGTSVVLVNNRVTQPNLTSTTTLSITATHNTLGINRSASSLVNFGYYFYYGNIPENSWVASESSIKTMTSRLQIKQTTYAIFNLDQEKIVFASPKVYGKINSILDSNGFNYITDYAVSELIIDGFEYYIYQKLTATTISNFKQNYTY